MWISPFCPYSKIEIISDFTTFFHFLWTKSYQHFINILSTIDIKLSTRAIYNALPPNPHTYCKTALRRFDKNL